MKPEKKWLRFQLGSDHAQESFHVKSLTKFQFGRALGLFIISVSGFCSSLWSAQKFAFTGYWDDTLLFVGLASQTPRSPWSFITFVLDQKGDLFGPYINLILSLLQIFGNSSNWFLIFLGNLAIVGLWALTYSAISGRIVNRSSTLIALVLLFFTPVLSDQRTWFIPIQHTLTICFALLSLIYTKKLLAQSTNLQSISIRSLIPLNFLVLILGLGREPGAVLALIICLMFLIQRPPFFVSFLAAWLIPVVIHMHRFFTGRTGSHVDWALTDLHGTSRRYFWMMTIRSHFDFFNSISVTVLLLLVLLVSLTIQVMLRAKPQFGRMGAPSIKHMRYEDHKLVTTRILLGGLYVACIEMPRLGTPLAALMPPFSSWSNEYLRGGRWSQLWIDDWLYLIVITLVFGITIASRQLLIHVSVLITFACTFLFLIDGQATFDAYIEHPASAVSRYAIYFLPVASAIVASALESVARHLKFLSVGTITAAAICIAVIIVPDMVAVSDTVNKRRIEYRSFEVEECGAEMVLVLTPMGESFTSGYVRRWIDEPEAVLLNDSRVKSRFPALRSEVVTQIGYLEECFYQLDLMSLVERLGSVIDSSQLADLEQVESRIDAQPESSSRTELQRILRQIPRVDTDS